MRRRDFLQAGISAGAMAGLGFEDKLLAEHLTAKSTESPPGSIQSNVNNTAGSALKMPTGKIGSLAISRLICGGNLISGFAHSRDLIYVSALLRKYFTDDKVLETLCLCESEGIDTAILRLDTNTLRLLYKYRQERRGKLQWFAQIKIGEDHFDEIQQAAENGASGAFVHGGVSDGLVGQGRADLLAKAVEKIRETGLAAGIGGHKIATVMACEAAKIPVDFYMKTLNSKNYWSAGHQPEHDNIWEETPQKTIEFMKTVEKPWIAYKVLGAGAIQPEEGFQYAYENGADFLCVGMFDFQVAQDASIARSILAGPKSRIRRWF